MNTRISLLLLVLLPITTPAFADVIYNWTDSRTQWPGWGGLGNEDARDSIGVPQITGGTVAVSDSGYLKSVSYNFSTPPGWIFSKMKPGDLFLDTNNDGIWDYVLSLYNTRNDADINYKYQPVISSTVAPLYRVTDDATYLITGTDNTGYWSGYDIRNNHPFAYTNLSVFVENGTISAAPAAVPTSPFIYGLPVGQVLISGPFTFGFMENCANDVVYETINPVPEPSTMLLLGSGLLGLVAVAKRKTSKGNMRNS